MPMLAFWESETLAPSEKVAPPPVIPKVLVWPPLFRRRREGEAEVKVVVTISDLVAGDGGGRAVDVNDRVLAERLAAGAAGDGEGGAGVDGRDADKLGGALSGRLERHSGRRWPMQ